MKHQAGTTDQRALFDEVRSIMAPVNPVAPTAFQGDGPDWTRPMQAERNNPGRWRVLAPALSGLTVVAVVVGVTLAGGTARPRTPAGGSRSLPRFYVTLNHLPPNQTAEVHSTLTGQTLTTVPFTNPNGAFAAITATRSGRVFYIVTNGRQQKSDALTSIVLRLTLSADGRSARLIRLPIDITDPTQHDGPITPVEIALSPDGRQLAVIAEGDYVHGSIPPLSEIIVTPMRAGASAGEAIWRAKTDPGFGSSITWVNNKDLEFLWQDHFTGTQADYTARTEVRLLNTRTSNRNLLDSKVLARGNGKLGLIESAAVPPGGGQIIASLTRFTPPIGPKGSELVRLVALSPATGKITKIFASRVFHYHGQDARFNDSYYYSAGKFDASGKNELVTEEHFGMMNSQGKFTRLPTGKGLDVASAW